MSNIPCRKLQPALFALILGVSLTATGEAQVGHPPTSSPYRDLRDKYFASINGGYSWGSGGKVEAGPANGPIVGARFDVHLAGPGSIQVGINWGNLNRQLIDPNADPGDRVYGTTTQSVFMADAGLILTFTGQKTWYGFAPYLGASMGLALGGSVPEDTLSTFTFNTKFIVGPQLGFRWHPVRQFFLRIEGRDMLWKLSYPNEYFDADPPVLDPQVNKTTEWTHNLMLLVSLGFVLKL